MSLISLRRIECSHLRSAVNITVLCVATLVSLGFGKPTNGPAQSVIALPLPTPETKAAYSSYRNVTIGMKAEAVRQALGEPKDKSDAEDFYIFSENESAQFFYDTGHSVHAISINFLGDLSKAPTPKSVVGEEVAPKPDGSIFKMVRYPRSGFWVSYSKTAGDLPTISITIQKI